jgi:RecA-family ATPase
MNGAPMSLSPPISHTLQNIKKMYSNAETRKKLNYEQASILNQYYTYFTKQNEEYLAKSNVHKNLLHDLLNQLLIHQPEDIFQFVQNYFSYYKGKEEQD